MVDLLLSHPSDQAPSPLHKRALATSANRAGLLPIHAGAVAGCSTCCLVLYRAFSGVSGEDMLAVKDKKGLTAADWARKHGHLASALPQSLPSRCFQLLSLPPTLQFAASLLPLPFTLAFAFVYLACHSRLYIAVHSQKPCLSL